MSLGPRSEYERKFKAVKAELAESAAEVRGAMDSLEDFLASSFNKGVVVTPTELDIIITGERYIAGLITAYHAQRIVHQCALMGYYQLAADWPSEWLHAVRTQLALVILEHEQAVERLDLQYRSALERRTVRGSSNPSPHTETTPSDAFTVLQDVIKNWKNNRKP